MGPARGGAAVGGAGVGVGLGAWQGPGGAEEGAALPSLVGTRRDRLG